ncbi:hypothetical protein [Niallia circulans]|uniref:hypothetical protein n=1 Tax=Niallia circulans TaxID=1397 RepID=UPI00203DE006|nr:hypothetical protein [Niallia circulans]
MNKTQPWYLRDKLLWAICVIVPPIAYIIIIANKNKLTHEKYLEHLTLATIILSIWLLKFAPGNFRFAALLTIIIALVLHREVGVRHRKKTVVFLWCLTPVFNTRF